MGRQRIRTQSSAWELLGRALVVLLALALIWGGLALALLALKVDAGTVNTITGYRSVYDFFTGIVPSDIDGTARAITAACGLAALLVFGYAARKVIPRPYRARHDLTLEHGERGDVVVEPRAIERLAEVAAGREWGVAGASGQYGGEDLVVNVSLRRTSEPAEILRRVQGLVQGALGEHGLPTMPVNVTLSGYQEKTGRNLN